MKLLIIVFVFNAVYPSFIYQVSRAQDFDNPSMTFQKFEFERNLRGGFNLSTCLVDVFTCMETVKSDVVCTHWKQFESVCGLMNDGCDEEKGYTNELYWHRHALFENVCTYKKAQKYT